MKILVINGSPRGKAGLTGHVLDHFIKGMMSVGANVEVVQLAGKNIHHCTGELACWFKTPARCIHHDDMEAIAESIKTAESFVIATPVYLDGMTGLLKNFLDRLICMIDPHFEIRDGRMCHPLRDIKVKHMALISTCSFWESNNFDPLLAHVKAICRHFDIEYAGAVLRPAAPIIPIAKFIDKSRLSAVFVAIERAGAEFATYGRISDKTQIEASAEIVSRETYIEHINKYFDDKLAKLS